MMKKLSIILLIMLMIISISAVSAADTNQSDDLAADEDSDILEIDEVAEDLAADNDTEVLSDGDDFTSLSEEINREGVSSFTLQKDYTRQDGENDIEINKDFTIIGNGYKIDANNLGRIFNVTGDVKFALDGVTLCNGVADKGGAIFVEGGNAEIKISNSAFINNTAYSSSDTAEGGAIYIECIQASVIMNDTVVFSNCAALAESSETYGGAVYLESQQFNLNMDGVEFSDCNVESNGDYVWGGALYILSYGSNDFLTIADTKFTNCDAFADSSSDARGAAVFLYTSKVTLDMHDVEFSECEAISYASDLASGAVHLSVQDIICDIYRTEFINCRLNAADKGYGGALYIDSENSLELDIHEDVKFINCSQYSKMDDNGGGALAVRYSGDQGFDLKMYDNVVFDNCSSLSDGEVRGGAVSIISESSPINLDIADVEFTGCSAESYTSISWGGAFHIASGGDVTLEMHDGVRFIDCGSISDTDYGYAGGLCIEAPNQNVILTMVDGIVFDGCNGYADIAHAGAVYVDGNDITLEVSGAEFTNCNCNASGEHASAGAIFLEASGDVNMEIHEGVNFTGCHVSSNRYCDGGAIVVKANGKATLDIYSDVNFINCNASHKNGDDAVNGGALFVASDGIDLTVEDVEFVNCRGYSDHDVYGGAIYICSVGDQNILSFTDVNFTDCKGVKYNDGSEICGGAIYAKTQNGISFDMQNTKFDNCSIFSDTESNARGGAIYINSEYADAHIQINDAVFNDCSAIQLGDEKAAEGGAIYVKADITDFSVYNVEFVNCIADPGKGGYGGAIFIDSNGDASVDIECVNFTDCSAFSNGQGESAFGGALYVNSFADLSFDFEDVVFNNCSVYGAYTLSGGAFYASSASMELSMLNVEFINCSAHDGEAIGGGALYLNGNDVRLDISDVEFTNCTSYSDWAYDVKGGAAYISTNGESTLTMHDGVHFTDCSASGGNDVRGGALYIGSNTNAELTLNMNEDIAFTNCNISSAQGEADGGAVYIQSYIVTVKMKNANFTDCTAHVVDGSAAGGAFYVFGDETVSMDTDGSVFTNCNSIGEGQSPAYGGAIYADHGSTTDIYIDGDFEFINCGVESGEADALGGAFCVRNENADLIFVAIDGGIKFINCSAVCRSSSEAYGGAVYIDNADGSFESSELINNTAENGGAVYIKNCDFSTEDLIFSGNNAVNGGALYIQNDRMNVVEIGDSEYTGNSAVNGGAIFINASNEIGIFYVTFINNTAEIGGAVYAKGDLIVVSSKFQDNKANSTELIVDDSQTNVLNITLKGNENHWNAIYLEGQLQFSKVEYWNGEMVNTDDVVDNTNVNESGQNITIEIYSGSTLKANVTLMTSALAVLSRDFSDILPTGTYNYNAYHPDDRYYTYIAKTGTFNVVSTQAEVNLTVNVENTQYGQNATIEVTLKDTNGVGLNATVTVKIDDVPYTVEVNNGKGSRNVSGLAARDNYLANATFEGNSSYSSANATDYFNVTKAPSALDANNITFVHGGSNSTAVDYTGATNVTAYVVDHNEATVVIGDKVITVSGLGVGTYDLNITTLPDGNHTAVSKRVKITVYKANSTVIIDSVVNATYPNPSAVNFTVVNPDNVTWTIVNSDTGDVVASGSGLDNISEALPAGNYTVTVVNAGNENVTGSSASANLTVNKAASSIDAENITFEYGKSGNTTVTTEGIANVTAKVVDHDEATVKVENGVITVSGLPAGNYTLNITGIPDENHLASYKEVKVTVTKTSDYEMNASSDSPKSGDNATVTVKLPENATGNVTVTLKNGTNYTGPINNGTAVINVPGLPDGDNDVTVSYPGDGNYTAKSTNLTIKVRPSVFDVQDMKRGWDSPYDYLVKLTDADGKGIEGKTLVFTIDGKQYNANTDANGVAKLTTSKLPVGKYSVTATNPLNGLNSTANLEIVKRIIENWDILMDYKDGHSYSVRAIGDDGNPVGAGVVVTIEINGVTYKIKTDKKGYAKLPINLVPRKYVATTTYHKTTVKNKVTVRQTLFVKKTLTVKKGKAIVLKATLKWTNGKVQKGKLIRFKLKGKVYKVKTNNKGVAKVTIKNKKLLKKFKKGKKYPYSAKYIHQYARGTVVIK